MPSTVTCSSLRQLLSALLASSREVARRALPLMQIGEPESIGIRLLEALQGWLARAVSGGTYWLEQDRAVLRDARSAVGDRDAQLSERDAEQRERELQILLATWL